MNVVAIVAASIGMVIFIAGLWMVREPAGRGEGNGEVLPGYWGAGCGGCDGGGD